VTVRVDGDLPRRLANKTIILVFANELFDVGRATEGKTGAVTILNDDETFLSGCINHGRVAQVAILDKASKLHEVVLRILELGAGLGVWIHYFFEFLAGNFGSDINNIAPENVPVKLRIVELD